FEANKRLLIVPSLQDIMLHNAIQTHVGDSLVYLMKNKVTAFNLEQLFIKRIMDITVSGIGIILTAPIMLITALFIKLEDGGPVFFLQERYTRNKKPFRVIKFRSMVVDAEKKGTSYTLENDDRITKVGRVIRKFRIDELPQLFNILKGDMALVGPRPESKELFSTYCNNMPEFEYRLKVKAGLTGYAQVYGKANTSFEDKIKMDLYYIESSSLLMDLRLLAGTLKILFSKESTEGFASEKENPPIKKLEKNTSG
ncbi:exopolysaccharide biosynthesis polyprenyl glycosylphosphotransferase, partial [Eubacteriales bacterium OttesenSCG-928-M02]|nr:exopolysaccharide biosynthesis polyprenyl glycosylphosphotransferase [Eubacteriales bacterium OttesenSCG-928-M02]